MQNNIPRCEVKIAPVLKKTSERLIIDNNGNYIKSEVIEEGKDGKSSFEQMKEARGKRLGLIKK